jgi:nucleotide-binding universal stress UspA family protein
VNEAQVQERFGDALVVAVDGSPKGVAALRFAARLAQQIGTTLHVLLVWNLIIGPAPDAPLDEPASEQDRQREAERVLAAFVEANLSEQERAVVQQHAVHANVSPLLHEVSKVAAHMIVGSRGRGGVAGLLLGSTSEELVRRGRCPITVVPTERPD